MKLLIDVMVEIAESKLIINIDKCKVLIFQRRNRVILTQIIGVEVVHDERYLGVIVNVTASE